MSEFSESFHLYTQKQESAVDLIKHSENKGYIFNEVNGWVTFVVPYRGRNVTASLLDWNPGLLVHYRYYEDHCWELIIYDKDDTVFEYKCDWTDDLRIEKNIYDLDLIRELILSQGNSIEGLDSLFDLKGYTLDQPPAYRLAEKLGLTYYEWLSADNIEDQLDDQDILVVD